MPKKISQKQKLKSSISNVIKIAIGERKKRKQRRRRRVKRTDEGMSSQQQKPQAQPQVITVNVPPYPMPPNYGAVRASQANVPDTNGLATALRNLEQRQANFERDTENYIEGTYKTFEYPLEQLVASSERSVQKRNKTQKEVDELKGEVATLQSILLAQVKPEVESEPLSEKGKSGMPELPPEVSDGLPLQGGVAPSNTSNLGMLGGGGGGGYYSGVIGTSSYGGPLGEEQEEAVGSPGVLSKLTKSDIDAYANKQIEQYISSRLQERDEEGNIIGPDLTAQLYTGPARRNYKDKKVNQSYLKQLLGLDR